MTDDRIPGFETVRAWDLAGGPDRCVMALARMGADGTISYVDLDVQRPKIVTTSPPCRSFAPPAGVERVRIGASADFAVDSGFWERWLACQRNRTLRVSRRHMTRRGFRRLRGRLKAERRAAKAGAYRLMKAKAAQLERAYEDRFYETMFGTVPPRSNVK